MAAADDNKAYQASGRLAYGCSSLAAAWPHGGTGLGLVGGIFLSTPSLIASLPAEETNSAVKVLSLGGDLAVTFTCRGWDNDALSVIFPNTATSNSHRVVSFPASTIGVAPTSLTNLVFTPNNPNHPGFVLYSVAPVLEVNAQLYFSAYRYLEIPALMIAMPDGSDRLGKLGKFSELSL